MAQKFIQLEAAAELLGITKEKLSELRDRGDAYAYRDGSSWKFKEEEIERIRGELSELLSGGDAIDLELDEPSELDFGSPDDNSLDLADGDDSILLSEQELGESQKGPSSTVIGKHEAIIDEGSDVRLAPSSDDELELAETSNISLDGPPDAKSAGSGIAFEDLEELELDLEAESSKILQKIDGGSGFGKSDLDLAGDDLALDMGSGLGAAAASGLALDDASRSGTSDILADSSAGSGIGGSEVRLDDDEDDELVLGEAPGGSDITLNTGDSGIGLIAASDSGLSRDEPLEIGGSSIETLELGDDEDISLEEEVDDEGATQLKADDDFLLTPLDDVTGDDLDDSGSQVIALDSESFDESADTLLGAGQPLQGAMGGGPAGFAGAGMAGAGLAGGAPLAAAGMYNTAEIPEAPYSAWNIISLVLCFLMLTLTGMMLFDLVRNMWSWDKPYSYNSSLMDALMEALPFFK